MYNSLVERCFKDCVESFRRKDLDSVEEKASCGWRGSWRAAWLLAQLHVHYSSALPCGLVEWSRREGRGDAEAAASRETWRDAALAL